MSISVSNNPSALLALQTLNRTSESLTQVQDQISTGLLVSQPSDNPSVWATAQSQTNQVNGLAAVTSSLNRATSISDVALSAGQTVLGLLQQMKSQALSAQDTQMDTTSRQAFNTDFQGLLQNITNTLGSADFDGNNLLDGSHPAGMKFITTADATQTVTLPSSNMTLGGSVITVASTASISYFNSASAVMGQIDASIANVTAALQNIGDQATLITSHATLVSNLSNVLQTGIGDLVQDNGAADSARLKALQVQQQLSQQSLNIANSTPQILLALFK